MSEERAAYAVHHCELCGQRVRVASSGENTCHYEPAEVTVSADEYARLVRMEHGLRQLADWCEERMGTSVYVGMIEEQIRELLEAIDETAGGVSFTWESAEWP